MSRKQNVLIAAAVSALLGASTAAVALAQTQVGTTQGGSEQTTPISAQSETLSSKDKQFMKRAAQDNMAEVAEGRIAAEKTQNPTVKAFAERMIEDHSQANDALLQVAQELKVKLPAEPNRTQQKHLNELRKLSAAQFDKTYDPMQLKDHEKAVHEFEREGKSVRNPALRAWVAATLPVLKEHLKLAQALPNNAG